MYQIVKSYINFLLRSTNQHGVHSPFVYNLVTQCFYDSKKYPAYEILKQYRKSLRKDNRIIQVKDFGAGSGVFKSKERAVSKLAKNAGISPRRTRLLNRLVRYLEVDHALEIGNSLGLGSAAMAAGNHAEITTIEGCPDTAKLTEEKLKAFGFNNIQLEVGEIRDVLVESGERIENKNFQIQDSNKQKLSTQNSEIMIPVGPDLKSVSGSPPSSLHTEFSLIYIGNHQKEATISYFEKLLPAVHNDSVMIFNHIHWSKEMEKAWKIIQQHPRVRVTIDTFQWGLVFFRREQEKEHFVIRV